MSEAVMDDQAEAKMDKEEDIEDERETEGSGFFANFIDLDSPLDADSGKWMTKKPVDLWRRF